MFLVFVAATLALNIPNAQTTTPVPSAPPADREIGRTSYITKSSIVETRRLLFFIPVPFLRTTIPAREFVTTHGMKPGDTILYCLRNENKVRSGKIDRIHGDFAVIIRIRKNRRMVNVSRIVGYTPRHR